MAVQKWDPFFEIDRLQNEMEKIFQSRWPARGNAVATSSCVVPVDIVETKAEVVIKAEIPGIDPKDVEVKVEDGILTISGEKKMEGHVPAGTEQEQPEAEFLRVERFYGKFTRSFVVPRYVDAANVAAEYRSGVLTLKLPRRQETQPRRIEVKVAGE